MEIHKNFECNYLKTAEYKPAKNIPSVLNCQGLSNFAYKIKGFIFDRSN